MSETFFFGDWQIDPAANSVRHGKQQIQLEPKAMDVLVLLCRQQGEVLSSEQIVSHCWPDTATGDNPLHKTITQLRKALGDTATASRYIETIRKRGYRTVAEVRFPLGQEQSVTAQSWQQGSPYPGLQAYDERFAQVFFGRGAQIDTLLSRIAQQIQYGRAFCLLLGPSGSGKSSLINAGVMPNLMQAGGYNGVQVLSYSSMDLADVASGRLLPDMASAMLDWELDGLPLFAGHSADSLAQLLQQQPEQVVTLAAKALVQNQLKQRFALFVDRLEVLLSSPLFSDAEREQFTQLLELFASSGAVLVLSACRNEFYPLLVDYPSLIAGKAKGAHFDLAAPGRVELLQMIRLPALAAGLRFDTDPDSAMPLDEMLCSEAASNPDALPMLQYTLQELYLRRSHDNCLLVSEYKALGGIEGAIGKNAEQAIQALSKAEQDCLPRVLSMLVTLREDEKSITSRSGRLQQLQSDAERTLVQTMVEQRLFVSHLQNGEPCFSIAHEALLRRWPRATAWINEHHDSLSVKSRLQHLARRWRNEQQHSAYLLADGKPLYEAQQLRQNALFQLEPDETEFIQASSARARLIRWVKRGTIALLALLSVTAVTMSVKSYQAEQLAQQKRLAAEHLLGFMVGDFADKLRSIGRMDLLDGISNKALEYFTDFASDQESLTAEARLQHGQTLEAMGEVAYSRGKTDEASAALLAARSQLEAVLQQQPDNLELLKTLGANAFWLGQIHYDASNWQATQPEFERYYQFSERMYELAPDNVDAIMELSYATNSLGSLAMKQQRFDIAQQNFEESLRLKLQAHKMQPEHSQLIADIADTRSWLASAMRADGEIHLAIQTHQKLQNELLNEVSTPEPYLLDILSNSYQILAELLSYQGKLTEARAVLLLGEKALRQAIEQDPENSRWQRNMFVLRSQRFKFEPGNDISEIEHNLEAEFEVLRLQTVRLPIEEIRVRLWLSAAAQLQNIKQFSLSQKYASLAFDSFSAVKDLHSQNAGLSIGLSESEILLANVYWASGEKHKAISLCTSVKQRLSDKVTINKEPRYLVIYAKALDCLNELNKHPELLDVLHTNELVDFYFLPTNIRK